MLQEKDSNTETLSLSTVDNDEGLLTRLGYKQGRTFLVDVLTRLTLFSDQSSRDTSHR